MPSGDTISTQRPKEGDLKDHSFGQQHSTLAAASQIALARMRHAVGLKRYVCTYPKCARAYSKSHNLKTHQKRRGHEPPPSSSPLRGPPNVLGDAADFHDSMPPPSNLVPLTLPSFGFLQASNKHTSPLTPPTSAPPNSAHPVLLSESSGGKCHAHDPLDEGPLFLGIGTGGEDSLHIPPENIIGESPIYDLAYELEEDSIYATQEHKAAVYLTRQVDSKREYKADENMIDATNVAQVDGSMPHKGFKGLLDEGRAIENTRAKSEAEEPGQEMKQSCNACRQLKIKCTGGKPCLRCKNTGCLCVYGPWFANDRDSSLFQKVDETFLHRSPDIELSKYSGGRESSLAVGENIPVIIEPRVAPMAADKNEAIASRQPSISQDQHFATPTHNHGGGMTIEQALKECVRIPVKEFALAAVLESGEERVYSTSSLAKYRGKFFGEQFKAEFHRCIRKAAHEGIYWGSGKFSPFLVPA
jgi:hypothetical protein